MGYPEFEAQRKALYPHLRRLMPARHEYPRYWKRLCGDPLYLHIRMPGPRYGAGHYSLARVCWNGGGVMAELRFEVLDPVHVFMMKTPLPGDGLWGACNHFCRCPGLAERLSTPWRLGARGLDMPTRADVLAVVLWCDEMLRAMYARAGLPFLAYRAPGWVAPGSAP